MIFLYALLLLVLAGYSFVLVDPNLTFFQAKIWEIFRDKVVNLGYYHRDVSWLIFAGLILLLFFFHFYFLRNNKKYSPLKIAFLIGVILVFSYPFLSHDFFNYLFDARIFTFYHKSPYLYKALDFPNDSWLRFLQWTHRTYPYGPVFLFLSFIPSFLSFGKFFLSFIFFKSMFVIFYLLMVYGFARMNRKWGMIVATHPLILIEGLVASHNDLIAISLAIIGLFYLYKKHGWLARFFLLVSAGIKYLTVPVLLLSRKNELFNKLAFAAMLFLLLYLSVRSEVQPWYFLNLFIFLPFFEDLILKLNIFFAGLLLSYYPYIRLGGWDSTDKVDLKHYIVLAFLGLNIIYYLILKRFKHVQKAD